jgi:hypothetical protein
MKKASLVVLGLAAILTAAAVPKADAGVAVGVSVGAPAYVAPMGAYGYVAPAYAAPVYVAPRPYVAFRHAPPVYRRVYVAPGPVSYRRWHGPRVVAHRDYDGWRR